MIKILLSTYNGARFLAEQIESILVQTYQDWQLVVRDDGSTDGTCAIIDDYCAKYPQKIVRQVDGLKNLGAMCSFEQLLTANEADYFMFCDQDDVWMADKIAIFAQKMQETEQKFGCETPTVIHGDMIVANERLETIAPSFWKFCNIHPEIIDCSLPFIAICNTITGCSCLLNNAAKRCMLPVSQRAYMHDAWLAIQTLASGGKIVPIGAPTMLYRQHGSNVLGAVNYDEMRCNIKLRIAQTKRVYRQAKGVAWQNIAEFVWYKMRYFISRKKLRNG